MYYPLFTIASLLASTAIAVPLADHQHQHLHRHEHLKRQGQTIAIQVKNNCAFSKSAGLFQLTSSFQMLSMSDAVSLSPGGSTTFQAPYTAIGMRLSGTADQGTAAQFNPQALFEFGYSAYGSVEGTAYNLSLMSGSASDTGIAVYPDNPNCETKSCSPGNCALSQGWTSPTQDADGSPADTTCYYGPTNFVVVFCP